MATITDFYKGQDIFITGGSGFLGKVLIEKLLRSCSNLNRIFILIRGKKGKSCEERINDIINGPLFERLRNENSSLLKKIIPLNGDAMSINLGLKEDDIELLKEVSIIFHIAASVRFDDPLKKAILLNTRGTFEVIKLAEKFKNLKILMHVSTTYCYPDKHVIDEKLYPAYGDWRETIRIAEKFDTETLNIMNAKFSQHQPNTYTFTKSLSEHAINDYRNILPVVIFRPSIVVSSVEDPISGWIDNFNGPVGMFLACGIGILRTMHGNPDVVSDFVPVDVVIKSMIICAYLEGIKTRQSADELAVYNCSTSAQRAVTTGKIIEIAKEINKVHPVEKMLWVPGGDITRSRLYNFIRFMLFHVLVAYFVDALLKISNHRPFLVKIQRRIYAANLALHYFATTRWTFINKNFIQLEEKIPPVDLRNFTFLHLKDMDVMIYFMNAIIGACKYLLNEDENSLARAKIKFRRIYIIDKFLKLVFLLSCFYVIWFKFKLGFYIKAYL